MSKRNKFITFSALFFLFDFAIGLPICSLILLIAAFDRQLASFIGHKLLEHAESKDNVQ